MAEITIKADDLRLDQRDRLTDLFFKEQAYGTVTAVDIDMETIISALEEYHKEDATDRTD